MCCRYVRVDVCVCMCVYDLMLAYSCQVEDCLSLDVSVCDDSKWWSIEIAVHDSLSLRLLQTLHFTTHRSLFGTTPSTPRYASR